MKNTKEMLKDFLSGQGLYFLEDNNNKIILPFRGYYKERVDIVLDIYDDIEEMRIGFTDRVSCIEKINDIMSILLEMNTYMVYGSFSLDRESSEVSYEARYDLKNAEKIDVEEFKDYLRYTLKINKDLKDKKIIGVNLHGCEE